MNVCASACLCRRRRKKETKKNYKTVRIYTKIVKNSKPFLCSTAGMCVRACVPACAAYVCASARLYRIVLTGWCECAFISQNDLKFGVRCFVVVDLITCIEIGDRMRKEPSE